MKIAVVFHKDPFAPPRGIDLVRLRALTVGLVRRGAEVEIVSPVEREGVIEGIVPVRRPAALEEPGRYDLIKTCYHYSLELIGDYGGPIVSRIVRVVDDRKPERDEPSRERLLRCQEIIRSRSKVLVLNNGENEIRWRRLYGEEPRIVLVPTGCPEEIPALGKNPFVDGERVMLFLGSLASPGMVSMLNRAARRLEGRCRIHLVGKNKTFMYGADGELPVDPLIVDHGELPESEVWNYIGHADIGIALAAGPDPFDNDVSKILNYLRGGLPVLSEEPIINNELVRKTGFGKTFEYGNVDDLTARAEELLANPPLELRESVMRFMARDHSWTRRVDTYMNLFRSILESKDRGTLPRH
jgi:glycosyltransferase involved in cell wall biosynthesis